MKRKDEHNIVDIFNTFCKERHTEDKGKNYNLLQEVYANTELFDFSHYEGESLQDRWKTLDTYKSDYIMYSNYLKNLALPFSNCFCKIMGTDEILMYVFIREYEPQINTGTFHIKVTGSEIQIPFTIYTEGGYSC